MFEYNRAVKNATSRRPKAASISRHEESVSTGSQSSSGKCCWRCKAQIDAAWRYCIVCGNAVNLDMNVDNIRPISPIDGSVITYSFHFITYFIVYSSLSNE